MFTIELQPLQLQIGALITRHAHLAREFAIVGACLLGAQTREHTQVDGEADDTVCSLAQLIELGVDEVHDDGAVRRGLCLSLSEIVQYHGVLSLPRTQFLLARSRFENPLLGVPAVQQR